MPSKQTPTRVVIMGAAGRDFHNFNMVYRDDPDSRVIAFTANQIPDIAGRRYPPALAGANYPDGIPIVDEATLGSLCDDENIDQVVFAYSDVSHAQVMQTASLALAAGADFLLLGPARTMLRAQVPVIAICAVRTGCGKSQTTRWLAKLLKQKGLRVAVIRHPMPYGDLEKQSVQRFAERADLDAADCTIEEREEYEPHLAVGTIVYAGVDYAAIVGQAEAEADVLIFDGGNNDQPMIRPDVHVVVVDPHRGGHESTYYPGLCNLLTADIVVINKVDSAAPADVEVVSLDVANPRVAPAVERAARRELRRGRRAVERVGADLAQLAHHVVRPDHGHPHGQVHRDDAVEDRPDRHGRQGRARPGSERVHQEAQGGLSHGRRRRGLSGLAGDSQGQGHRLRRLGDGSDLRIRGRGYAGHGRGR